MELYWKAVGAVLTTLILGLHIGKQERDFAVMLAILVCCLGTAAACTYLEPVLELLREMEEWIHLDDEILRILLKCAGIAIVTEIAAMICQDGGCSSMGKMVHLLGSSVILYLSVPVVTALMKMLREILGGL